MRCYFAVAFFVFLFLIIVFENLDYANAIHWIENELVIGVWFDNLPRGATQMQQKRQIIDNELHASVDMKLEHILNVLARI